MSSEILGYILKWFVPFACAGLFSLLIKPIVKDWSKGRQTRQQQQWNENAITMQEAINKCCEENIQLTELVAQVRQESQTQDAQIEQHLQETKQQLTEIIKENTSGVREALLTTHLYNLIRDSKLYIEQGWISVDDWQDYVTRYDTYIKLGGNGHMDNWYPKVKDLPNHPPVNQ